MQSSHLAKLALTHILPGKRRLGAAQGRALVQVIPIFHKSPAGNSMTNGAIIGTLVHTPIDPPLVPPLGL